jgi:2-aminoadipate transaminase
MAQRAARLNPSVIREILKLTELPGCCRWPGLPAADTFPVEAMREATARVLTEQPQAALQYAASEGYGPLREWVAERLREQGMTHVKAEQVLMTTGSQQGLDLIAKVMVDAGAPVAVETPTYLGALQAFTPFEPLFAGVASDGQGRCRRPSPACRTTRRAPASCTCCPTSRTPPAG